MTDKIHLRGDGDVLLKEEESYIRSGDQSAR